MQKILVVEDEKKLARYLELELSHEGYDVRLAHDGRSAISTHEAWKSDLILLDLMLPELSGIEVCRRIRQKDSVPIIMLTAKDDVSDKVMGLDMGADDYMTKPFAIEELLARIRVALKRQSGEGGRGKCAVAHGRPVAPGARQPRSVVEWAGRAADAQGVRPLRIPDAQPQRGAHAR